ncbi:MAG: hypothetical protein ACU0CI_06720 [Shimia sp.]
MRAFALMLLATPALADDFKPMTGAQITEALTDTSLTYETGATQRFYASGRTLYDAGRPSWGAWEVRDDLYCSEWPPASGWDCYAMDTDGAVLRFIGPRGDVTVGVAE